MCTGDSGRRSLGSKLFGIHAFLRAEPAGQQSFYIPASAPAAKQQVDAPAWPVHADFNADGEISRREFLGSPEQFTRFDANQDGYLAAAEAAAFVSECPAAPQVQ